jgi:hypothetical protein
MIIYARPVKHLQKAGSSSIFGRNEQKMRKSNPRGIYMLTHITVSPEDNARQSWRGTTASATLDGTLGCDAMFTLMHVAAWKSVQHRGTSRNVYDWRY